MSPPAPAEAPLDTDAVQLFMELTSALHQEVISLISQAKADGSSVSKRSAVRAAFAAIEGLVSATKGMVLEPLHAVRPHYTDAEIALLREETYSLTSKGDAVAQPRFLRLEENVRFVWKMFVREWGIDLDVDFQGDGWMAFCSSVKVRNRITHPRTPSELEVTDAEFSRVEKGYAFVHNTTLRNIFRSLQAARHQNYALLNHMLPNRVLGWLDSLAIEGQSPAARALTSDETATFEGLGPDAQRIAQPSTVWTLLERRGDSMFLLQQGADYLAWRIKTRASVA
jgi:hypothetical protein